MRLIFLGAPGAGKGTQAQILADELKIPKLSTGDILRAEISSDSPLGLQLKDWINQGNLVSDDIMDKLIKDRIARPDCTKGFILDGYPRTTPQAEALEGMFPDINIDNNKFHVINLSVREKTLISRFSGRYTCKKCSTAYHLEYKKPKLNGICDKCGSKEFITRPDDGDEAVKLRLNLYNEKTAPLINYYKDKGMLYTINGEQDIAQITHDIKKALKL